MWFPRFDWKKGNSRITWFTDTNHIPPPQHFSPLHSPAAWLLQPPDSIQACLMVVEARHREWPGESFDTVAQIGDASHGLWILEKEVLEVLELSWRTQQGQKEKWLSFVLSPLGFPPPPALASNNLLYNIHRIL